MNVRSLSRLLCLALTACLLNLGFLQTAGAAAFDTAAVVQLQDRGAAEARIDSQLSRQEVRTAMVDAGIDPDQARARVASLTDAEVQQLDQKLAELPAAGDLGWILLIVLLGVLVYLFATNKLNYK
ncbi:MAG: PA2779 family protein [Burkholderiales bacterium]|nr:PA2779 family protein [Burkholderiales bacterium]